MIQQRGMLSKDFAEINLPETCPSDIHNGTEKCYLTISDKHEKGGGHLVCTYNHKKGERCLMDKNNT